MNISRQIIQRKTYKRSLGLPQGSLCYGLLTNSDDGGTAVVTLLNAIRKLNPNVIVKMQIFSEFMGLLCWLIKTNHCFSLGLSFYCIFSHFRSLYDTLLETRNLVIDVRLQCVQNLLQL